MNLFIVVLLFIVVCCMIDVVFVYVVLLQVVGVVIVIVDVGVNLFVFVCIDDCFFGVIDFVQCKVLMVVCFCVLIGVFGVMLGDGLLCGIEYSYGGFVMFGGGELFVDGDGCCVGVIGILGGSVDEDIVIVQYCCDFFQVMFYL